MFLEAMGLSLAASLLAFEIAGLSPGGLIVPGYLALLARHPTALAAIAAASFLVLLATKGIARQIILFGRRRFVLMVLLGVVCLRGIEMGFALLPAGPVEVLGLGYLVPGLVANDMEKQGVLPTLLMTVLVSAAIRLVLVLISPGWLP
jgi:poly-gamma-glutamate biosynthesis protein PgsC/CapC